MMHWACERTGVLLERRASGIEEHERLVLEQHLSTCPTCAEQARLLSALAEVLRDGEELSARARRRAITQAFAQAEGRAPAATRRRARGLVLVVAAAALVLLGVGLARPRTRVALVSWPAPGAIDTGRWEDWQLAVGAEVALAHAHVRLSADGRARWASTAATLRLQSGSVHVEVDPAPGKPFAVTTPRFRVDVLGTAFDVTLDSVRVTRGRVRVTILDKGVVEEVAQGQSWSLPAEPAPSPEGVRAQVDVPRLLLRARKSLAAGEVRKARADLEQVFAARARPDQTAEARTLWAECALVAGDAQAAQKGYAEVAKKHAKTAAGDNAAFAAARLERDPDKARKLLVEYLASYPNGQFRKEAEARLAALPK